MYATILGIGIYNHLHKPDRTSPRMARENRLYSAFLLALVLAVSLSLAYICNILHHSHTQHTQHTVRILAFVYELYFDIILFYMYSMKT